MIKPLLFFAALFIFLQGSVSCSNCNFTVITESLGGGTVGEEYSQIFATDCENATWEIISDELPPGLELVVTGSIEGVPEESGSFSFMLKATGVNSGDTFTRVYSITISEPAEETSDTTTEEESVEATTGSSA